MPTKHFTAEELRCKCGCGRVDMDAQFMARLEALRVSINRPLTISSGFRCVESELAKGRTGNSAHTKGRAVDVSIRGKEALELVRLCQTFGFTGVGVSQFNTRRFIHLDDIEGTVTQPRPHIWSY